MSATVVFSEIKGTDLVNVDRATLSDPYVVISSKGGVELTRTENLRNEVDSAEWAGPYEASVPVETLGEVKVAVMDRDRGPDDPMGHVIIQIPAANGTVELSDLALTGVAGADASRLSLKVSVSNIADAANAAPAAAPPRAPTPTGAAAAPAVAGAHWTEAALPAGVVTRKEVRKMSEEEQTRVKNAYMKMRENKTDDVGNAIKGSSEWCRLASYHGGFPGTSMTAYCSHGRENFPNWHRPYLIDFEQMLRRADMALGGDSFLGLPYWGWEELSVHDQVMPKMVREMCAEIDSGTWAKMQADDPTALDFYPGSWENRDGHYWLGYRTTRAGEMVPVPDDSALRRLVESADVIAQAERSLHMSQHREHASSTYARGRAKVSIEQPHGTMHVHTGDVMKSHRSSFHPIFWMHHCNIDRFYQAYLEDEGYANSKREFERHQRRRPARPDPGYPDGPWGRLEPFYSNGGVPGATTEATMAPTATMGYEFDSLPRKHSDRLMREAPWYASFEQIRVATLERPCAVYVYVYDKASSWTPPAGNTDEELLDAPGFAGSGSIFFFALPDKPCDNCQGREPYDMRVDVTDALRKANLHPKRAALGVMVADDGGKAVPVEQTKVPVPVLRGPRFFFTEAMMKQGGDEGGSEEVEELQRLLVAGGYKETDTVDGDFGGKTEAAVRKFQKQSGITEDGVFGPESKRRLTSGNLTNDGAGMQGNQLNAKRGATVSWWLDADSVPTDLPIASVEKDLAKAFAVWAEPTGLKFTQAAQQKGAKISISFDDRTPMNDFVFDGPGGALAEATASSITFDESDRWCLSGGDHKKRPPFTWDDQEFELLTIAIHEIGHVLGLKHSESVADVMSPFYFPGRIKLSPNDIAQVEGIIPGSGGGKSGSSSACDIL